MKPPVQLLRQIAVLLACLLSVPVAWAGSARATRQGHLLLIGGGSKPPEVLRLFVRLAGGPDARLVVMPTASGEPDTGEYYQRLLADQAGARRVEVCQLRDRRDAFLPDRIEMLGGADGVFFSGGDQSRITRALLGTPALRALRTNLNTGAVVGGTSAGTACMSDPMMDGRGDPTVLRVGNVGLVPGLGFFPGVLLDQHFLARRRQGRLVSALLENPHLLGLGIDEATALWLKPDDSVEVLGEGWVTVYDPAGASVGRRGPDLGVQDLRTHYLLPGACFDLVARTPLYPCRADPRRGSP